MSKSSFRPLADFSHAGELLLAIHSLSHRFPGQGRHVWISASSTTSDVTIMTLKYGAIPNPDMRRLYPFDLVPESELQAMQYLHRKLGWQFHESGASIPNSCTFLELVAPPSRERVREARLRILSELGLNLDDASDPQRMVSAQALFPIRIPAPPARRVKMPPPFDPRSPAADFARGEVAYIGFGDIETARRHFQVAAQRGHPKAQHRLATIYAEERAYRVAIKWCRLAAWQGLLPEAQYDLARMYYYGQGVTRDVTESRKWMLRAAEAANADAMYGMGVLCPDLIQSYAWFKLAALRKSDDAAKAALELRSSMTAGQIVQAEALMATLRAKIHRPSKRTAKPKLGTKRYVGSQEVTGSVCPFQVEYSVQRLGDDRWILHLEEELVFPRREGPMYADALAETLEANGLDVQEFLAQLSVSEQPALRALAQEIKKLGGPN